MLFNVQGMVCHLRLFNTLSESKRIEMQLNLGVSNLVFFRNLNAVFVNEVAKKYPDHTNPPKVLEHFFKTAGEQCKDKNWQLRDISYDDYIDSMELQDDVVHKIQENENLKIRVLLLGNAIILRYDSESLLLQEYFKALRGNFLHAEMGYEELIQRIFTFDDVKANSSKDDWKKDPNSEAAHVRNAFAHGHVKFLHEDMIRVWDELAKTGQHNYDNVFSFEELIDFYNEFGKRLDVGFVAKL